MTMPFIRAPITIENVRLTVLFLNVSSNKSTMKTKHKFPSMMHGIMPGTACITGADAMKNAVIGVIKASIDA